jgi:hypothetical protein
MERAERAGDLIMPTCRNWWQIIERSSCQNQPSTSLVSPTRLWSLLLLLLMTAMYHFALFCFSFLQERPLAGMSSGVACCTLRVRNVGQPDYRRLLRDCFVYLFSTYPGNRGFFDLSVTCNSVLESSLDGRVSVWFGQTFSDSQDFSMGPAHVIRNLGDVSNVNVNFSTEDFQNVFAANFDETSVFVREVINVVFVITKYLSDYNRMKTVGARLTRIY